MSLLRKNILSPSSQSTLPFCRSFTTTKSIRNMTSAASKQVHRTTLFKIPNPSDVQAVLDKYATMAQDAKKVCIKPRPSTLHKRQLLIQTAEQDGKPYILRCVAGAAADDARSQGYTLAAQMTFSSMDDMKYYDTECETHAALKAVAKSKVDGPPLVTYFDNAIGTSS